MLSSATVRQGMNYSIMSAVLGSFFLAAVTGPVLAGLLLALKMSNFQIGMISSMGMLFLPLQVFGALLQQRYFQRKRFWYAAVLVNYSSYLVLALLVSLWSAVSASVVVLLFMIILAVGQVASQLVASVFLAWLGELVPAAESNTFWNRRQGWAQVTVMVASIGVGVLVDMLGRERIYTYVIMILMGTGFGLLSLWIQGKAADPELLHGTRPLLLGQIRKTRRNRRVWQLIFFFGFQQIWMGMASPFFFIYLQQSMRFTMTTVQLLTALSSVIGFFSGYLFSAMGNRYGRKRVLVFCTFLKAAEFIFWGMLLPGNGWCWAVPCFVLGGIANMGMGTAQLSLLTSVESKRNRSFSIGVFFAVCGLCGFASGSLSGMVYDWLNGVQSGMIAQLTPFNWICLLAAPGYLVSLVFFWKFEEDKVLRSSDSTVNSVQNSRAEACS